MNKENNKTEPLDLSKKTSPSASERNIRNITNSFTVSNSAVDLQQGNYASANNTNQQNFWRPHETNSFERNRTNLVSTLSSSKVSKENSPSLSTDSKNSYSSNSSSKNTSSSSYCHLPKKIYSKFFNMKSRNDVNTSNIKSDSDANSTTSIENNTNEKNDSSLNLNDNKPSTSQGTAETKMNVSSQIVKEKASTSSNNENNKEFNKLFVGFKNIFNDKTSRHLLKRLLKKSKNDKEDENTSKDNLIKKFVSHLMLPGNLFGTKLPIEDTINENLSESNASVNRDSSATIDDNKDLIINTTNQNSKSTNTPPDQNSSQKDANENVASNQDSVAETISSENEASKSATISVSTDKSEAGVDTSEILIEESKSTVRIQCRFLEHLAMTLNDMPAQIARSYFIPRLPLASPDLLHLRFGHLFRVERCPNGYGKSLHLYLDEIVYLKLDLKNELAEEFIREAFRESRTKKAVYVISIVHGGASYMPDWLEWLNEKTPDLPVKAGVLGQSGSDIETTTIKNYCSNVN